MIVFDPAEHSPGKSQGMLSSLIVPRPIAMVSTTNVDGLVDMAPFSYYMPVTGNPPLLAVTIGGRREGDGTPKHTRENLNQTGDFVINVTAESMRAVGRMALPYLTAASHARVGLERSAYQEHLESGVLPGCIS